MILLAVAALALLGLVLLIQLMQLRKCSELSRKGTDLAPVLNGIHVLQNGQEQVDRSVREEVSYESVFVSRRHAKSAPKAKK